MFIIFSLDFYCLTLRIEPFRIKKKIQKLCELKKKNQNKIVFKGFSKFGPGHAGTFFECNDRQYLLDIIAVYHNMQNERKLMIRTQENGITPSPPIWAIFGPFCSILGQDRCKQVHTRFKWFNYLWIISCQYYGHTRSYEIILLHILTKVDTQKKSNFRSIYHSSTGTRSFKTLIRSFDEHFKFIWHHTSEIWIKIMSFENFHIFKSGLGCHVTQMGKFFKIIFLLLIS